MPNPINWGGLLEPYLQPLKERLGMLPLGQYEDGSVRLAWPGILADPVQHGMRAAETPIPAIDDNEAWAAKSRDMFDAAGLATTGALGANMAGGMVDNALGSAGAKLTQSASDLPMDLASRMARAREMGFDTDRTWYHGTDQDFGNFDLGLSGLGDNFGNTNERAVFLTDNPAVADSYLGKTHVNAASPSAQGLIGSVEDGVKTVYGEGSRVLPVNAKYGDYEQWDMGGGGYTPEFMQQALREAREAGKSSVVFENMRDPGLSNLGRPKASNILAILDPRNIRSTNAAFDPAKSDSANLLAANAPTGSAIPLGLESQQQDTDPNTLTAANILRLLRGQ